MTELARGGYTLAEAPAPDVLRLRASILDADFAAPKRASTRAPGLLRRRMTLRVLGSIRQAARWSHAPRIAKKIPRPAPCNAPTA